MSRRPWPRDRLRAFPDGALGASIRRHLLGSRAVNNCSLYAPTLNAFRYLKQHWLVSISALIHRSEDVGLIDPEQAKRLWIAMARRGWRRDEPLDDVIPVEEPRLLRTAFELVVDKQPDIRGEVGSLDFRTFK